jgi:hypothetical protein
MSILSEQLITIIIIAICVCVIAIFILYFVYLNRKKNDQTWKVRALQKLDQITNDITIPIETKIINLDKNLEYILQHHFFAYNLKLQQILLKFPEQISNPDLDNLWFAHEIRKQLTTERGYGGNIINLENAINSYVRYSRKYCR